LEHIIHFVKDLRQTGTVVPSSKFLAKDLVEQLKNDITTKESTDSFNILEIGPGTGPLTKQIAQLIRPCDQLDIVEIHDHFFQTIRAKYQQENISIYHQDILQFSASQKYDYIFSSLPYEAMNEELAKKIWQRKLNLCQQKAFICYFKYVSFRKFKCDFEKELVKRYQQDKKIVLRNFPPARVFTLQIQEPVPNTGNINIIEHVA